ncbi:hypothetical protein BC937DRAFT_86186 [Endogone sp. FLAS-F59071]|nr:hypothetical protein BC937DRAFT_86186 [Endogone sp. FLAS-F59071]|eukprot:RUS20198.1 hypothetical protein BC937DRAFT_86186 [Endogone sp. FLAS-F59071]
MSTTTVQTVTDNGPSSTAVDIGNEDKENMKQLPPEPHLASTSVSVSTGPPSSIPHTSKLVHTVTPQLRDLPTYLSSSTFTELTAGLDEGSSDDFDTYFARSD